MSKQITTSILIDAPSEKVWNILTDFKSYSHWNPFIKSLQGDVQVGKHIEVRLDPPGAKGMTFKPEVLVFDINKEFKWIGHLFFAGLFDGEHRFQLIDHGNGTTTLIQSERFEGVLIPLFKKMLDVQTVNGFKLMNEALKARAEKK